MRLLVIGATGGIGGAVTGAALAEGHTVTALVRSAEKLGEVREQVRVVEGDLSDATVLATALDGQEAVISAIGSSPAKAQLDAPAEAMRNVAAAMETAGVRRLIGLAGGAVSVPGERKPVGGRIMSALVRLLARNVVEAKQREFEVVRRTSLDWTMVRPPRVVEGDPTGHVAIGLELGSFTVTQGDLGTAMVRLATGSDWIHQVPYVYQAPIR